MKTSVRLSGAQLDDNKLKGFKKSAADTVDDFFQANYKHDLGVLTQVLCPLTITDE